MSNHTNFNGWQRLDSLGRGGQGEVFRAQKTAGPTPIPVDRVTSAVKRFEGHDREEWRMGAEQLVSIIREIATEITAQDRAQIGALKVLHPIQDKDAAEKAAARMARELGALEKLRHPSVVRVFETSPDGKWFVMEYFSRGTLNGHLGRFCGDALGALRAFRPLVEAVSQLHKNGYVHRDIKPANVFVADDGHLVLGDFGLVIDPSAADARLTDTYENVGSRDWMPGWAMGMRMDEVKPNFDVFSLGKLLW